VTHSAATHLNRWPFRINGELQQRAVAGQWRSGDSSLVAEMVLSGLGIGRLSSLVAAPMLKAQRLVPVLQEFVEPQALTIQAVYPGPRQRLPKIRACVEHWADWFAQP